MHFQDNYINYRWIYHVDTFKSFKFSQSSDVCCCL